MLTESERGEIDRANASGLTPVVFVHGLWLLSSSWDPWRALFEENGYTTVAPGWPDDPATVEEARAAPSVFAHKMVGAGTDPNGGAVPRRRSSATRSAGSSPSGSPAPASPRSP